MPQPLSYFVVMTGTFHRDKAKLFMHALGDHIPRELREVVTAGLLSRLWDLAASRGEDDGSLGARTSARLAVSLGWPYDPDVLVQALLDVGLLDQDADEYRPHDWADWQTGIQERQRKRGWRKDKKPNDLIPVPGGSGKPPDADDKGRKEGRKEDPPKSPRSGGPGGLKPNGEDPPSVRRGGAKRANGTSPRQRKTNPRANGKNPRGPVEAAWQQVFGDVTRHGSRPPDGHFEHYDEPTLAAVRAVKWQTLCGMSPRDRRTVKAKFMAAYSAAHGGS